MAKFGPFYFSGLSTPQTTQILPEIKVSIKRPYFFSVDRNTRLTTGFPRYSRELRSSKIFNREYQYCYLSLKIGLNML